MTHRCTDRPFIVLTKVNIRQHAACCGLQAAGPYLLCNDLARTILACSKAKRVALKMERRQRFAERQRLVEQIRALRWEKTPTLDSEEFLARKLTTYLDHTR